MSELKPWALARALFLTDWPKDKWRNHFKRDEDGNPDWTQPDQAARLYHALALACTPALLRGARIGLEMAAKRCSEYAYEVARKREGARAQHFMGAHVGAFGCAENIRLITDADIMKEISRE